MQHTLPGRKQTAEHIARRMASYPKERKFQDMKTKLLAKIRYTENDCWEWTGAIFHKPTGDYGQVRSGRRGSSKTLRAHRVSYETFVGEIPRGLELDHLCHNTLCINPAHLEPVTHTENMKRRKDSNLPSCRHGHLYTPETTYIRPDNGYRECGACRIERRFN